jgi:hypothetical protein
MPVLVLKEPIADGQRGLDNPRNRGPLLLFVSFLEGFGAIFSLEKQSRVAKAKLPATGESVHDPMMSLIKKTYYRRDSRRRDNSGHGQTTASYRAETDRKRERAESISNGPLKMVACEIWAVKKLVGTVPSFLLES